MRAQYAFGLAAANRVKAMRGDRAHCFAERVVLLELRRLVVLVRNDFADELAVLDEFAAHERADFGGVGDRFGGDVARAGECVVDGVEAFGQDGLRFFHRITFGGLRKNAQRERLGPFSRATDARVLRRGRYGAYKSSSSDLLSAARSLPSSSGVSLPCSVTLARIAARRVSSS